MRVSILAPINNSLYSRLVTHLLCEASGIDVVSIVIRTPWTYRRIRSELKRDGIRLLRKAFRKLVLRDSAYSALGDNIMRLVEESRLPNVGLSQYALMREIPFTVVRDHNSPEAVNSIVPTRPDVIVFTGGGLIRAPLLEVPRLGILNCHMGPLPKYRGMDVVEWPILEQASRTADVGMTTHFMDSGVDTGPVLISRILEKDDCSSFREIRDRMEPAMVGLVVETVKQLSMGCLEGKHQRQPDGRQYFLMHPRLYEASQQHLRTE